MGSQGSVAGLEGWGALSLCGKMRAAAALLIMAGPGLAVLGVGKDLGGLAVVVLRHRCAQPHLSASPLPSWGYLGGYSLNVSFSSF